MSTESEVARLLAQINAEYESAQQGLSGLAQGVGQHRFITKRTEQIAELHEKLHDLVGNNSMDLITNHLRDAQIAQQLQATRDYAVDPRFKEDLRKEWTNMRLVERDEERS
jgi:hypothetical protein